MKNIALLSQANNWLQTDLLYNVKHHNVFQKINIELVQIICQKETGAGIAWSQVCLCPCHLHCGHYCQAKHDTA